MLRIFAAALALTIAASAMAHDLQHPIPVAELENNNRISGIESISFTARLQWVKFNCEGVKLNDAGNELTRWYIDRSNSDQMDQAMGMAIVTQLHELAAAEGMAAFCKRLAALDSVAPYIDES